MKKEFKNKKNRFERGLILVNVMVFGFIAITVTTALVNWGGTMLKNTKNLSLNEQAFQIAEAGIDYYRWHLAHAPTDYKDGTGSSGNGPFIHDFKDKDGNIIGQFALTITPPLVGSTLVKVKSTGTVLESPSISRSIQISLAIPSFAKYAAVSNSVIRFGEGTEVFGPIHSNDGVRFDGLAHNIISSAKDKYIDPDQGSHNPAWYQFGVYTTVNPTELNTDSTPPTTIPNRPDVFMVGRQVPVPAVDFVGITTELSNMKAQAQANNRYYPASGAQGYRIVLKTNDTFDLYRVNSLRPTPNNCINSQNQTGWGTWSVNTTNGSQTLINSNVAFPTNGIIFVEDHLWIEGQINSARLTIAAGRFPDSPSTRKDITINNDLLYTNYDGQDAIALVAQGNITTGLYSDDNLRIDAALVAQNGRVGRFYYISQCGSSYIRAAITLYGMIATNLRYGYAYTNGTGYIVRNIIYDSNLLYSPPPSFPLTSDQYITLSWEEVK